jgi:hypothetical protein
MTLSDIQKSIMSEDFPATNVELQHEIDGRRLTLPEAMRAICEQACSVANSDGVAIAVLNADQLVYQAGGGTAAAYVGQRVMAMLRPSGADQAVSEILRVEDAETDSRIQAAICRQFGARSLLILSLCSDRRLSGILQISFDQPHQFLQTEVDAYRTLAGLAEQAMAICSRPGAAEAEPIGAACPPPLLEEGTPLSSSSFSPALWSRTEARFTLSHLWDVVIAAMVIVGCVGLVLSRGRTTVSLPTPSASPALSPVLQPAPVASSPAAVPSAEDTVESTTTAPAKLLHHQHAAGSAEQVRYFGDDVTVRHFAPKTAVVRTGEQIEVRRVSDDVTVRYFPSSNAPHP